MHVASALNGGRTSEEAEVLVVRPWSPRLPKVAGISIRPHPVPLSCDLFLGNGAAAVAARSGSTSNATNVDDNPLHKIWARGSYVLAIGYSTNRILPHFCH